MKQSTPNLALGAGFSGTAKLLSPSEATELFLGFLIFERVVLVVPLVPCPESTSLLVSSDPWAEDTEVPSCFLCLVRVLCLTGLVCSKLSFSKTFLVFVLVLLGGTTSASSLSDSDLTGGLGGFLCFVRYVLCNILLQ